MADMFEVMFKMTEFIHKHFVILSLVLGIGMSWVIRRLTRPVTNMDDYNLSKGSIFDPISDKDGFGGKTDKYTWTQNEDEVDIYIPSEPELRARDVSVIFKTQHLEVQVNGMAVVKGQTFKDIIPDECVWQLDKTEEISKVQVWITLRKKTPTERNQHWAAVIHGDASINPQKFGPTVTTVNTNDEDSIREAVSRATQ